MRTRIFRPRPWSPQVRVSTYCGKTRSRRPHELECAGVIRNRPELVTNLAQTAGLYSIS
jgi:hypothetical protein